MDTGQELLQLMKVAGLAVGNYKTSMNTLRDIVTIIDETRIEPEERLTMVKGLIKRHTQVMNERQAEYDEAKS